MFLVMTVYVIQIIILYYTYFMSLFVLSVYSGDLLTIGNIVKITIYTADNV